MSPALHRDAPADRRRAWLALAALAALMAPKTGCVDRPLEGAVPDPPICCDPSYAIRISDTRAVDILFVVDNSGSMADEQALLQAQFPALMQTLRNLNGGMPDVHIGVTSTDLGTGMFQITYCEEPEGDAGSLLTGDCTPLAAPPYLVDTEPKNCFIEKDIGSAGELVLCPAHDCAEQHCTVLGTTLQIDERGCPRCRNYGEDSLAESFACRATLGTWGCGFEQPLEAMYKALDPINAANAGFVRDDAILAVVLITDEDDCSARNPRLFDNSQTAINSTLGPLTSFRCFEFGITCDRNARTAQGRRQDCVPREDPGALLHPVSRYTQFLRSLKAEERLVVAAIAGPFAGSVSVGRDEYDQPAVQPSCATARGGAVPGVRLKAFVEAFNGPVDLGWAYTPICSPTYTDALQGVAEKIAGMLDPCFPFPLKGCADPAVLAGLPGDGQVCNDTCRPGCTVQEVREETPAPTSVPPCLQVCPAGPCPQNVDPAAAYAEGHPDPRDPSLPVPACWQVVYNEHCHEARGAEVVIARRADPPAGTRTTVSCQTLAPREQLCQNGLDDDEDCLIDTEDPDCG